MIGDLGIQKPGAFLELFLSKIHMGGALPWDDGIEQAWCFNNCHHSFTLQTILNVSFHLTVTHVECHGTSMPIL